MIRAAGRRIRGQAHPPFTDMVGKHALPDRGRHPDLADVVPSGIIVETSDLVAEPRRLAVVPPRRGFELHKIRVKIPRHLAQGKSVAVSMGEWEFGMQR